MTPIELKIVTSMPARLCTHCSLSPHFINAARSI
jgi:hypothetical protein